MAFDPTQPYGVIADTSPVLYVQSGTIYRSDTLASVATVNGFLFAGTPSSNVSTFLGVVPLTSQTISTLTTNYPPASYQGFTAYTTDQGLVFSNGTAWLLTTDTSVKAGLLPGSSNASANATAIMNAAAGGNITVKLPAGAYYVGPMVITSGGVQIQGEGVFSTTLTFVPTGNVSNPGYSTTDPGTCFQFCTNAGQTINYNSSIRKLAIQTSDTSFSKCGVRLCETSQFVVEDILVTGFYGGDSVGLQVMGHELTRVSRLTSFACVPIRMSPGLRAYGAGALSGVTITGTAGQFSCTASTLSVGQSVTISGTYGGTGSITGYTDPKTYTISATNGTTTFTLVTQTGGALVTTAGTPTGLTINPGVCYTDHFHFSDLYLAAGTGANNSKNQGATFYPTTLQAACILMDDNMFVSNLMFDGSQAWVGGQYGFYCSNTRYCGSINYQWSFRNVRKEQGWGNSQMYHYNNTSSDNPFAVRQMYFENCYNTEGYDGWNVQGTWFLTMVNCMSPVIFSGFVVNAPTNVLGMEWRCMWCNSGDLVNFGQNPISASYYTGYKSPFSASWPAGGFPIADQQRSIQVPTTGFNITISNTVTALILNPAGTLATGTVKMCAAPNDGMEVTISTSQTITALTVSPNTSQSIVGAPTTLSAGGRCHFIYDAPTTTWYIN